MTTEQTQNLWETNPELYVRDVEGNFVLKKDGTPKKIVGKKKGTTNAYNHHSETKAKIKTRRAIAKEKRELAKLETKVYNKRSRVKKKVEVAKKLDGKLGVVKKHSSVMTQADLDVLPQSVKDEVLQGTTNIVFQPNPGPQTDFLAASEVDVLYGGAAGGGKSFALLNDPLRYIEYSAHRPLLLRRTLPELEELIDISRELYPKAFPGAEYKEAKKLWEFPSGAKMKFGYLEREADVYQYAGKAFSWIGFDELTQLPTEFAWNFLRSRLRSTDPFLRDKCVMRATANPGGAGHDWVKKRYIDPAPPNTTIWESYTDRSGNVHRLSRKFIPALLSDNPYLHKGGQYEAMLHSLDPVTRERLLNGDWDISDGAAFPEFNKSTHVIEPFAIPPHWERFKAIDYGYRAQSCVLWFAVDPSDGTLIVYRELYEKGLTGEKLGIRMAEMEADEPGVILGILDTSSWNQTGTTGPTVGEEMQSRAGGSHRLRKADKNRQAGKIQVHERLRPNDRTGRPKVQFFFNCVNIIKQLSSLPLAKNDKEDVDTTAEDHAYDAFRYGVMSRPRMTNPFSMMGHFKKTHRHEPADALFGY